MVAAATGGGAAPIACGTGPARALHLTGAHSLGVASQAIPQDDWRKGLAHIGYGAGIFAVASSVTWLAEFVQVEWLGGNAHLVAIGAFLVGIYELLYGAGICLFRTGMLGVLIGGYAFGAFCLYGLLHWTLSWF